MTTRWIFSRTIDLVVFGATAVIALALVLAAPQLGIATSESPEWTWIAGVLLVDVAHVWSTTYVVYLDPAEWKRRPWVYALVPLGCFVVGVVLYATGGPDRFWRVIAYLAVFHFVRQQYGWMMLYRARCGERDRATRLVDGAAIYLATIYPLIAWHAKLPRAFAWMRDGDFIAGLPAWTESIAYVAYVAALGTYVVVAVVQRNRNWGKHLMLATTAACWYVGIVATNSDYAFTITNVFIHGVPYLALVYIYARRAAAEAESKGGTAASLLGGGRGIAMFLGSLWLVAYVEELAWDRAIWHDRPWLFGSSWDAGDWAIVIAPLLATPQLAHYVLDGFLWRRRSNPRLGKLL